MPVYFRPAIPDPYPRGFDRVTDFAYGDTLVLARAASALLDRRRRETSYVLAKDYTVSFRVDGAPRRLTAPAGLMTDLVSVPRLARGLIGRVGPHLEAAIVHDFLFVAWQLLPGREPSPEDLRFANAVMAAGLEAAGVAWAARLAINAALALPGFAWSVFRRRDLGPDGEGGFVRLDGLDARSPDGWPAQAA